VKKTYFEVEKSLKKLYPQEIQGYAKQRLNQLIVFVTSLLRESKSSMSGLGSSIPADIQAASREKQAKRFLEHKDTTYEIHYLPLLRVLFRQLLANVSDETGFRLVIDGTQVNKGYVGLMISLVVGKRAIPISWVIQVGQKGHFSTDSHLQIIKQVGFTIEQLLRECERPNLTITLLGDGEFDSLDLQVYCPDQFGWKYIFRTASNSVLHDSAGKFHAFDVVPLDEENFVFLENIEFTNHRYKGVHFLYWHDKECYADPIYLVSNWKDAMVIKEYYKQRFSIETMFKDFKTRGFNMHQSRLQSVKALTNLLMLISIAFCLLMNFGQRNEQSPLKPKVQRVRKPTEKQPFSLFSFAKNLLKYCRDRELTFCLVFEILIV
jgi:Transposase DDE domain